MSNEEIRPLTPLQQAIRVAIAEVDKLPPDGLLLEAGLLLDDAFAKAAAYRDTQPPEINGSGGPGPAPPPPVKPPKQ